MSAWGGYVFIINLIPLHVFALLLMGRYSARIYTAYTTFFILGLLLSMQVPFVGFQPIRTSEHMASAGKWKWTTHSLQQSPPDPPSKLALSLFTGISLVVEKKVWLKKKNIHRHSPVSSSVGPILKEKKNITLSSYSVVSISNTKYTTCMLSNIT